MSTIRSCLVLTLAFFALVPRAEAQRFDVTGSVVDTAGVSLPQATVVALTRVDSVLTKFTTSGNEGQFTLRRLDPGAYILQITYVGFQTYRSDFDVADADVDVGLIRLAELQAELDEIVVSADHIPLIVKRDTLIYNADAFATRPNDVVEDLLRRLPGIEVESDGSIKAQGETVENVLVDGKEFFAETPSVATKSLPARAVDEVQVYDKLSDQAEFTGIPDGEEEKTIDLQLKEEAKRGVMGNVGGALGGDQSTGGRYEARGMINRFSPKVQLSLTGNANNIGQSGFGVIDIMNMMQSGLFGSGANLRIATGGAGMFGPAASGGFTESASIGLNGSTDLGTNSWIRSSYFLNALDQTAASSSQRHLLTGFDAAALGSGSGSQQVNNQGHALNLNTQIQFSPGHQLRARSSLKMGHNDLFNSSVQTTLSDEDVLLNSASSRYDSRTRTLNGTGALTWRKRLAENGRSIVARANVSVSDTRADADLLSSTGLLGSGNLMTWEELQQEQEQIGEAVGNELRLSLTEPLNHGLRLELFGERDYTVREEDKRFFDTREGVRTANSRLSDAFERTYGYYRAGVQLSRSHAGDYVTVGVNVQRSRLHGTAEVSHADVRAGYVHVMPRVVYRHTLRSNQTLSLEYRTSTREPSLRELQPYTDNSNPLRIYAGNPDLTPEYKHTVSGSIRTFDSWTQISLFADARAAYTHNQIVPTRLLDASLRQTVSAVNSGGGWNLSGDLNFSSPIRPLRLRVSLNNDASYSTGSEFINNQENTSRILRNRLGVTLSNRDTDILEVRMSARATFNKVDYSLNSELGQQYINESLSLSADWYATESWMIEGNVRYRTYDQDVFGNADNVALVNLSITRLLMDERAELELGVRDVFNQNLGVTFSNTGAYIQEQRTETLGRHILLRFTYRLNALGGLPIM